jgi:hypothetical protein
MTIFRNIRAGDRVAYITPQGQTFTGRAQRLLCFPSHVVVDAGRGRPVVVDESNYRGHRWRGAGRVRA